MLGSVTDYVGRFAPSPTGRMHVGVARTCLGAWLDARRQSGRILLRIEDIDAPRVVPGAADEIRRDLEWLGLDWDEGPDRVGAHGPYFQSEREGHYLAALERLTRLGRTYPCTCSRKEIALASSAPHGPSDEGPRYPETCRDGRGLKPDRPAAIRLCTEPGDVIHHRDRLFGDISQDVHREVGDFVIRRAPTPERRAASEDGRSDSLRPGAVGPTGGLWAYQLAVAADDLAQGITCVVRGADLLGSTPRQLLLRRLLDPGAAPLSTLHLPLVRGEDGKRLAKRDGTAGIAGRRQAGERPERVIGALAASLGLVPPGTELTARELVPLWDPARIAAHDTTFTERGEFDPRRPMF